MAQKWLRLGGISFSVAALVCGSLGCKPKDQNVVVAPGAPSTTTVVTPGQPAPSHAAPTAGNEVADVKAMISQMRTLKDFRGLSEYFTNESAAAMGLVLMIPVSMMSAFEGMGDQMGKQLGGQAQGQAPAASPHPKIKAELEATLKKYGLSEKTQPTDKQAMASVNARGREFLADMAGLLEKLDTKGKSGFKMDAEKAPDPEDATYEVISPSRVKITPKHPKDKVMENMEARWEDGRWRLHIGNFEELMKKSGMSGAGAMPRMPSGLGGVQGGGMGTGTPR